MKKMDETPIRVLQLFASLGRGGAETMIMNYYRAVDRTKVQFDFVVRSKERCAYEDEIERLGGRIFHIAPMALGRLSKHLKQVKQIFNKTDYSFVHGHIIESAFFIFREANRRDIPTIAHSHNTSTPSFVNSMVKKGIFKLQKRFINSYFACGEDAGIVQFGKESLLDTCIISNAIDANLFAYSNNKRAEVRIEMKWDSDFIIVHVGRFDYQKNHPFLITVFYEFQKIVPNSRLVLVGGHGALLKDAKKQVSDLKIEHKVSFLGGRSDVFSLLQGADLFLMPSRFEGLPVSLVEAQASGIKIVASTNVPQESRIIANGVDFLSLKLSPKEWAAHIAQYKDGYNRRNTYTEIVNAGFDIKKNAEWLQNYYIEKSQR